MFATFTEAPDNVSIALWYRSILHCSPRAVYVAKQCTETVGVHD